MADVASKVGNGLWNAVLMAWEVWWALVLGFAISAIVQAWVPRERIQRSLLGDDFFNGLFLTDAPSAVKTLWGAFIGPVIAVLSFVCSVGNIPLAAVLWSGGISFAGVMAFIFADLIVLPIIAIYRKYYGWGFALRIIALMFVTTVLAALAIDGLFSLAGLVPDTRPSRGDIFGSIELDYKL